MHCQHFCRTSSTYLKRLDYALVLEVPDEDLGVATPTDEVAAAVQETAASEAPTTFLGGGGGGGWGGKEVLQSQCMYMHPFIGPPLK